jgi:diaminopimelate decarboxylase
MGALTRAMHNPWLDLVGLHAHIGSQILEVEPFVETVGLLLDFAVKARATSGFALQELSPGGGWGVPYHGEDSPTALDTYVEIVSTAVVGGCQSRQLPIPRLVIEPGRSIVAPAAVALYRVGSRKEITGVRTYLSVDGGMADNIRPALYGAHYTALAAEKADRPAAETVTIAGRFCESGDVLIRDISMPRLEPGDLLGVPVVGAYCLPLASNYNLVPRPAVVLVKDGIATVIQRRETLDDLVARDLPLPARRI